MSLEAIRSVLHQPAFLMAWAVTSAISLAVLGWDLAHRNAQLGGMMKLVWALTTAYSSFLGLAVYFATGRRQIARDSLWRRGFRSTAHCYSGCGLGEILGVTISVGALAAGQVTVAIVTFSLAYLFGLALTVGPLMQDGVPFTEALQDAVLSETASIVVMEAVAIGVDLTLAGDATMGEPLFWSSLIVSLTVGLLAAYPVNVALIHFGVKEGMHDPRGHAPA